jgi:hypothetical protein
MVMGVRVVDLNDLISEFGVRVNYARLLEKPSILELVSNDNPEQIVVIAELDKPDSTKLSYRSDAKGKEAGILRKSTGVWKKSGLGNVNLIQFARSSK